MAKQTCVPSGPFKVPYCTLEVRPLRLRRTPDGTRTSTWRLTSLCWPVLPSRRWLLGCRPPPHTLSARCLRCPYLQPDPRPPGEEERNGEALTSAPSFIPISYVSPTLIQSLPWKSLTSVDACAAKRFAMTNVTNVASCKFIVVRTLTEQAAVMNLLMSANKSIESNTESFFWCIQRPIFYIL